MYNGICGLIDKHIAETGIVAPTGQHYEPVWQPDAERDSTLDLAQAGVSTIVWATGFRSDWSFVDLPLATRRAIPATPAA